MKEELAQKFLEKVKVDYNYGSDYFSRRSKPWGSTFNLINKEVKDGEKVLDVGCGDGRFLEAIKDKKIEYLGVDNSEELIKIAKKKFPNYKFQIADVLNLPLKNNNFDVMISIAVLHHIPTSALQLKALREMYRVLKPGGKLLMTNWMLLSEVYRVKRIVKLLYCYGAIVLNYLITRLLNYPITKKEHCLGFKDLLIPWDIMDNKVKRYYYAFSLSELVRLVKKVGFTVTGKYYSDRKKKSSWWQSFWKRGNIVVVAEK